MFRFAFWFLICVAILIYGMYHEEKLIEFEQAVFQAVTKKVRKNENR